MTYFLLVLRLARVLGGVIAPVIAGLVRGLCFVPGRRCHVASPQKVSRKKVHGPARAWHASVSIRNPRRNQKPLLAGDLVLRLPHTKCGHGCGTAPDSHRLPHTTRASTPYQADSEHDTPVLVRRVPGSDGWRCAMVGMVCEGPLFRWECCWASRPSPPA